MNEIWSKIQKITGRNNITNTTSLIEGSTIITDAEEIANKIAEYFAYNSSNKQYNKDFIEYKTRI